MSEPTFVNPFQDPGFISYWTKGRAKSEAYDSIREVFSSLCAGCNIGSNRLGEDRCTAAS